ncbi:MAG: hypothetical protein ABIC57_00280 [bacterium]
MKQTTKKIILLVILFLLTGISLFSASYILDKNEIIDFPDDSLFGFLSKTEVAEEESDTTTEEEQEPQQETLFAEEITSWPTEAPERFPVFSYGTITRATGLGENDRYDSAWILEFTGVTVVQMQTYADLLETDGWELLPTATTDDRTIIIAQKDQDEISLMHKTADNSLLIELISY